MKNFSKTILLASNSPRRHELLRQAGLGFTVVQNLMEETFPQDMPPEEVPRYLAEQKAEFNKEILEGDEILITADTIVKLNDQILGKPNSTPEATELLKSLSGKWHEVITGVCLLSRTLQVSFSETTRVKFRNITEEEIDYYVRNYMPYDKAGAYGIQEWIGLIGIDRIEGSYFNVVGLPINRVWYELQQFH
ncbi:Maf family nucleotide pyrophosphatase [Fulvivirga sedimenti]|uniref:dTTP/UTP pyrophosphatase n=1 Tax=Fulvivirga sedimenti TaxID=2879465 RepID=A0A9X1HN49_9BACT|nr:Maf family nucleotide pyrophosphatase [Fulvivirga sedimenti]MCA6074591.1 Maf family nucleotide pyrophosphatase [Fulvivirga sedimenti]MCA6075768.1 Maf family nucleotide pyrophosphatase [Fulvivirga sedimenti]MCA6076896.1 Maf family nucleotide pyrophosphatase [Fulvivirga sedimenti]